MRNSITICGHNAIPKFYHKKEYSIETGFSGYGEIHKYEEDGEVSHGFYGLKRCKNSFFCPCCGAKILAHRRTEIEQVGTALISAGYQVLFVTFTAPHAFEQPNSYYDSIKRFQAALRFLKQGKAYQLFKRKYGLRFSITSAELTLDDFEAVKKSGIHWHLHIVFFFDKPAPFTEEESKEFQEWLAARWYASLVKTAYILDDSTKMKSNVLQHGVDVRRPWLKNQSEISDAETVKNVSV